MSLKQKRISANLTAKLTKPLKFLKDSFKRQFKTFSVEKDEEGFTA